MKQVRCRLGVRESVASIEKESGLLGTATRRTKCAGAPQRCATRASSARCGTVGET
jgi:hypothetical protein